MRKPLLTIALTCLPLTAAAQPYSESMADCAAHFQNAAQWMSDPDRADRLIAVAYNWHAGALAQAAKEGQPTTADAMWARIDTRAEALEAKGKTYFLTEDFRDWSAYCRSFARHTGISSRP